MKSVENSDKSEIKAFLDNINSIVFKNTEMGQWCPSNSKKDKQTDKNLFVTRA